VTQPKRILALDLGTKTGWCLGDPRGPEGGTMDWSGRRHESAGMRYVRFKQWLDEVLPGVWIVAYEEVARHKGVAAAHIYGGLLATLQTCCEAHGVEYLGVPVGTIKKTATGKGNADKVAMVVGCIQKLGVKPADDNEADARWLLFHAIEREGLDPRKGGAP